MKRTLTLALVLACVAPNFAAAQVITTPYWCGSYWSSSPCGSYTGGYWYGGLYNYAYPYSYLYPYNYSYPYYYYGYTYPTYPTPTCSITIRSYSSGYVGGAYGYSQPLILSWSSSNASSAFITNVGSVAPYGSIIVYPYGNTTYTMTVYGSGGSNTCQTTYYRPFYYYPQQHYQYPYYF